MGVCYTSVSVDGNVMFGNEGRDLNLRGFYRRVQFLESGHVMQLELDCGCHERGEPPAENL